MSKTLVGRGCGGEGVGNGPGRGGIACAAILTVLVFLPAPAQAAMADPEHPGGEARPAKDMRSEPPVIEAIKFSAAPVIDGVIEDLWLAGRTEPFQTKNGTPSAWSTEAYVGYDEDSLDVAFKCLSPTGMPVVAVQTAHDSPLWEDDDVEVFLDVTHGRRSYFHFIVNPAGVRFDEKRTPDGSDGRWNPSWQAKTSVTDGCWTAEMKIPFAELTALDLPPHLAPSSEFGINLCRIRQHAFRKEDGQYSPEYSAMGPAIRLSGGSFHSPASFAALKVRVNWVKYADRYADNQFVQLPGTLHRCETEIARVQEPLKQVAAFGRQLKELGADFSALLKSRRDVAAGEKRRDSFLDRLDETKRRIDDFSRLLPVKLDVLGAMTVYGIPDPRFGLAVVDSMEKIGPDTYPWSRGATRGQIALAKNEYESIQIVVMPLAEALGNVRVSTGVFSNRTGAVLSPDSISIHPVGYVQSKPGPLSRASAWIPDILLDNGTFGVESHVQPVWITVHASPSAQAGLYEGDITVSADGVSYRVALQIDVYDFVLPDAGALKVTCGLEGGAPGERAVIAGLLRAHRVTAAGDADTIAVWYSLPLSPSLRLDNPGIDPRMIPWLLWREGTRDFRCCGATRWGPNEPRKLARTLVARGDLCFPEWEACARDGRNGEGVLVYPGARGSVRLANLRDGIEDYEYLAVLRRLLDAKRARLGTEQIVCAELCLKVEDSLAHDWQDYNKSPVELYRMREGLARMIEKLDAVK